MAKKPTARKKKRQLPKTKKAARKLAKYVYSFAEGKADGNTRMKELLGGKGANLAEMANLGLPVPPGFTITTQVCTYFYQHGRKYPAGLQQQADKALEKVETIMDARFGDTDNPLLLSVRSGARVSMPGMMETVLNIGLNDETIQGLIRKTNNPRFAYDAYRRLMQMFSDVVMEKSEGKKPRGNKGIREILEGEMDCLKEKKRVKLDVELTAKDLKRLCQTFRDKIKDELGKEFPQDPKEQLWRTIGAVFASWQGKRAVTYREIHDIPHDWGTAVNVQTMVFGNMGEDSGTGVLFTRNPATGDNHLYGEWLPNAQGEDVVAGIRTPQPINQASRSPEQEELPTLEEKMPTIYKKIESITRKLERHYHDIQDVEFTVQQGRLFFLQTRVGKRTAPAAVKIAVDMAKRRLISKEEAIMRVTPEQIDQLLHPRLDPEVPKTRIARGLGASTGAAYGHIVFTPDDAVAWVEKEEQEKSSSGPQGVILVRHETSPEDIGGMKVAKGILTARGGLTSHAAVVAKGMGKPCVVGCGVIMINYEKKQFTVNGRVFREGDLITLDGSTGEIFEGTVSLIEPKLTDEFLTILKWADQLRRLGVWTNADTPTDVSKALEFGAEGIGLCRTEHMFFAPERITAVREMIMAETPEERERALAKIEPFQRQDFLQLFTLMKGKPVTIRLLDPPLHEFLPDPQDDDEVNKIAETFGRTPEHIQARIRALHEANPMMGHRGCRLGITHPQITRMQSRAIFEAAAELKKKGEMVQPEVMVPLVGGPAELADQKKIIDEVAKEVMKERGVRFTYNVGTMIEVPRGALMADKVAEHAAFFSFGTNDLTQMTYGFSRDDIGSFFPAYIDKGILPYDVFRTMDFEGVGQLVRIAVEKGRKTKPELKVGICGEHGGDAPSVEFCHRVGLTYVSCSPYRVPIARFAAAQAQIKELLSKKKLKLSVPSSV